MVNFFEKGAKCKTFMIISQFKMMSESPFYTKKIFFSGGGSWLLSSNKFYILFQIQRVKERKILLLKQRNKIQGVFVSVVD